MGHTFIFQGGPCRKFQAHCDIQSPHAHAYITAILASSRHVFSHDADHRLLVDHFHYVLDC